MRAFTEDSLLVGHDLDLDALAVEVVEAEALARGADVVYAAREGLHGALELLAGSNLALNAVLVDVVDEGGRHMELVGVGVRRLGLLELEDAARADFKVLLWVLVSSGVARAMASGEKMWLWWLYEGAGGNIPRMSHRREGRTHIRVELLLRGRAALHRSSRLGRGRGGLFSLLCLLFTGLFTTLELAEERNRS